MRTGSMTIGIDARILTLAEQRGMAGYLRQILQSWPEPSDRFVLFAEHAGNVTVPARSLRWRRIAPPRGSRIHIGDLWALPRAVAAERPDVFWSPANLAFPLRGIPQVVTVHDTLLQERVPFSSPGERFYYRQWTPFALKRFADRVITVSRFSRDRIRMHLNYPKARIRVIPNGAERAPGRGSEPRLSALGLEPGGYMYALGAESPWKNTFGLLAAFALARAANPALRLVVSGIQGRFMDRVRAACKANGLDDGTVRILGFVDENTRDSLYAGARLFVYPSLFEGFGLPPLEAMAAGVPVVASDAASIPEVVGNAALMADAARPDVLAAAIVRGYEDEALRRALVSRGKTRILQFRWQSAARAHRQVLAEAAGCRS